VIVSEIVYLQYWGSRPAGGSYATNEQISHLTKPKDAEASASMACRNAFGAGVVSEVLSGKEASATLPPTVTIAGPEIGGLILTTYLIAPPSKPVYLRV
jgi:hypothetical protein